MYLDLCSGLIFTPGLKSASTNSSGINELLFCIYYSSCKNNKLQFYKLCILIPKNCGLRSNSIGGGSAVE